MRRTLLVATLVVATSLTGCLGSPDAAEIPSSTLQENDWKKTSDTRESVAGGLAEKVTKQYRPRSAGGPLGGASDLAGAIVVSATDAPLLDESRFIPQALEQVERQRNIELTKTGSTQLDLVNLDTTANADVYTFSKGGVDGRAVLFTPSCSAFVVTVGYGVLVDDLFQEAKNVASGVAC